MAVALVHGHGLCSGKPPLLLWWCEALYLNSEEPAPGEHVVRGNHRC